MQNGLEESKSRGWETIHRKVSIVLVKMVRSWNRKIIIVSARADDILDYNVGHGDGKK